MGSRMVIVLGFVGATLTASANANALSLDICLAIDDTCDGAAPLTTNDTEEGRRENRRVALHIVSKGAQL